MINKAYTAEKCGMQAVDKKHVQEVIESISTPEYKLHSEKKQADLERKVRRMKEELKYTSIQEKAQCQSEADEIIFHNGVQRNLSKVYVHIDMDSYFASVEMRDDPKLRNVPMCVGSKSMISTSNYMARAYGVRSAMPGYIGEKLCPQLVFVSGNYTKYSEVAKVYRQLFKQYDPKFYYVGVDEATLEISEFLQQRKKSVTLVGKAFGGDCDCRLPAWTPELANQYLDAKQEQVKCEKCGKDRIVWSYERTFGVDVSNVVEEIRFKVEQETGGLTCSAGVAPNYMLAKICSEQRKPNNHFLLKADTQKILAFVHDLNIRKIPGIGGTTEALLNGIGIRTCKDVIDHRQNICRLFSKKQANFLLRACSGISSEEVIDESDPEESKQSISHERTFTATNDKKYLEERLNYLADLVFDTMKDRGFFGCSKVAVKVKFSTFKNASRTQSTMEPLASAENGFKIAKGLLGNILSKDNAKVRLVGVVLSDFVSESSKVSTMINNYFQTESGVLVHNDKDDEIIFDKRVKVPKPVENESSVPKPIEDESTVPKFIPHHSNVSKPAERNLNVRKPVEDESSMSKPAKNECSAPKSAKNKSKAKKSSKTAQNKSKTKRPRDQQTLNFNLLTTKQPIATSSDNPIVIDDDDEIVLIEDANENIETPTKIRKST